MEWVAGRSIVCFSDCVSPFPKGKATAVGGEPGVTKAVLTRIQVMSPAVQPAGWVLASASLRPLAGALENLEACGAHIKRVAQVPFLARS